MTRLYAYPAPPLAALPLSAPEATEPRGSVTIEPYEDVRAVVLPVVPEPVDETGPVLIDLGGES